MKPASRTPEGEPNHCIVCGHSVSVAPTHPPGDAPCPNCGTLLWFEQLTDGVIEQLAERGAHVETDEQGQVTSIKFTGDAYNDSAIAQLAKITGVRCLDLRETAITAAGVARLRELMPGVSILH